MISRSKLAAFDKSRAIGPASAGPRPVSAKFRSLGGGAKVRGPDRMAAAPTCAGLVVGDAPDWKRSHVAPLEDGVKICTQGASVSISTYHGRRRGLKRPSASGSASKETASEPSMAQRDSAPAEEITKRESNQCESLYTSCGSGDVLSCGATSLATSLWLRG